MTLSKQVILIVIGALLAVFIGAFIITFQNTKNYFEEQLQRNSQDTATALGLTLSEQIGNNPNPDTGVILSKVNAVFDRGYFSLITVKDIKGKVLVNRFLKPSYDAVPQWFKEHVSIYNEKNTALIMRGWQQLGEVIVQSDSNLAYEAIWKTITYLFLLFFILTTLITLLSVLLIKLSFRPLKRIIQQAHDIGRKKLYTLDLRPRLRELALLSTTINAMVKKLKNMFKKQIDETERLRAKVYKDSLTGLGNRRYFFQQLNQYISNEEDFAPGFLILIELSGLISYNEQYGYQQGDELIIAASRKLREMVQDKNLLLLARLDGPSFAVILEHNRDFIESLTADLFQQLEELLKDRDESLSCVLGVVKCNFSEDSSNLMSRADKAIQHAQQSSASYFIELEDEDSDKLPTTEQWKGIILKAIHKKKFNYYSQPVLSDSGIYHQECFIKLVTQSREIAAREFFSIAEQYFLGFEIDKLVLHEVMQTKSTDILAINLSLSTVNNLENQKQFLLLVDKYTKQYKTKLHFEIAESMLHPTNQHTKLLVNGLLDLGHLTGLDRVGATLESFKYLKNLNITYLKLDASLSKNLEENKLKQEFITNLITTTQQLDITLIATAIESESQWVSLKQLGITHFQGNYLRSPAPLKPNT